MFQILKTILFPHWLSQVNLAYTSSSLSSESECNLLCNVSYLGDWTRQLYTVGKDRGGGKWCWQWHGQWWWRWWYWWTGEGVCGGGHWRLPHPFQTSLCPESCPFCSSGGVQPLPDSLVKSHCYVLPPPWMGLSRMNKKDSKLFTLFDGDSFFVPSFVISVD